jgi:hypothetical protein
MPVVKFFESLDLDPIILFLDRHDLVLISVAVQHQSGWTLLECTSNQCPVTPPVNSKYRPISC